MYQHAVILALQKHQPISAVRLLAILKKTYPKLNKTTVYRQLDKLKENKQIQELSFTSLDEKLYEITSNHHHAVCLKCKEVSCLKGDCHIRAPKTNFTILGHNLEFFGLCGNCK